MKENSIERDIHLLESYAGMTHKMNDNQGRPKLDQAIEHILRDYKRILKENESLQKTYDDCYCKYKHYKQFESISVQKVKDKIEEYENEIGQLRIERNVTYDSGIYKLELKREALQELLKKE